MKLTNQNKAIESQQNKNQIKMIKNINEKSSTASAAERRTLP
jgi:hypothetical protein